LVDRTDARWRYDAVVAHAADWQLPRPIRDAMRAWRFDEATTLLAAAADVLTRRTAIESAASVAGLTPPPTLRETFQGTGGFAAALDEATAEVAAIAHYQAAVDAKPAATQDLVTRAGLLGATPEVDLEKARMSFAAGDLESTAISADAARSVWASAADVGRGRVVSAAALALAMAVALILLMVGVVGRRRRHRGETLCAASMSRPVSHAMARPMPLAEEPRTVESGVEATRPYATLAATPEEALNVAVRDVSDTGVGSG
ncbi:MAG: hypothetical protein IMZ75_09540, partial [Actinobacteria bacterium]|nr:hypothetical protein [Actinomycetota bacterium]